MIRATPNEKYSTQVYYDLIDLSLSFVKIVDSKFIGLAIFMISNYFTGIVNLAMESTHGVSEFKSLLILSANSFVSTFLPFYVFYSTYKKKNLILIVRLKM